MKIEETFGGSIDDSGLEKLLNSVINSGNNGTVNTTLNIKPKVDKNNDLKMLIKSLSDAFSLSEDLATSLANVYKTGKNNRANKLFDFSDETLAIEKMTQAYKEFLKAQESGFKGQKERAKITDFISAGSIIKAGRGNLDIIPKEIAEAFEKAYSEVTAKSGGEKYAYSISNFKALISALDDIKNTNPQANLKEIVKYLQTEVQHKSKEVTSSSNKLFKGINIEDFLSFDNTRLSKELEETFDQLDRLEEKFDKFDGIDNLDLLPDINKAELEDLTNERIELEKIAYVLIEIAKQRKFKIDDVLGGGYYENYEDAQRNLGLDSLGTLKHDKELLKDDKFNRKDEFIKGFREAVAEYISNALQRQVGDFENQLANDKVIQSVMNSDDIADEFKEKFNKIIDNARERIKNGDVFGIANVVDQLLKENIVFSDEVFKAYLPNFNIKDENVDDYNKLIETKIDELWDNTKADIITIYDLIDEVSKTIDQNGWRIKSEAQQEIDSYFNKNNNGNGFGFGGGNNYNESEADSILNGDYSDEIQDYSRILELLERIYTVFEGIANTVDNLSKSIGVISDENGFASLLSTLKDVNSYFENIRDIVEDIASRDLSPTLNIQASQSGDTYSIRKRAQRYKENYENAFNDIGYTNLFSFLAQSKAAEKYEFSADRLKKQFGSEAINGIENKEDQIERIVQFFKLIDAAIDERAEEIETARKLLEKGVGSQSDLDALINDETYSQLLENQSRRFVSTNQKYINKQNAQSIAQANNSPLSSANKLLDSLNDASIVGKLDEILNVTQSIYSTLEAKRTRGSGEGTGRNSVLDALREEILPKYNRVSSKAKYDVVSGNWSLSSGMSAEDLDIVSEITKSIKKAKEKNIDIAKLFSEDGQDIAEGIAEGIEEGQSAINGSLTEITNKAQEHFEDINIIHSPARRWYPVGENITLGIAEGVKQGYYSLEDAMDYITHLAETEAGRNIISEDSTKDLDFKGAVTPISELRAELVQMGYDADVVDHILFDMRETLYNGFDESSVIGLVSSISMLGGVTEEAKNDIRELTEVQEENAKVTNNEADTVETLQHELNNNQEPIKIKVEPLVDANEFVGDITSVIQNVPAKVKVEPEIEEKSNTSISESVEKAKQESEDVVRETNVLTSLLPIIQQVTDAVNLKTQAFENEGEKVNEVVLGEFNALQKYLLPILEELRKAAEELSESFKGFNSVNTFINKLTGNNSAETIKTLGKNLKSLGTYLTNLKIDDTQFIDAINNIVSNAKDLKKVIDVIEKANKNGISSKKKGKAKKEKDPAVDLYKELTKRNNRIIELDTKNRLGNLSVAEHGELETLIQQFNRIQQQIENIGSTSEEASEAFKKFKEAGQDATLKYETIFRDTLENDEQVSLDKEVKKLNKAFEELNNIANNSDKYTESYRNSIKALFSDFEEVRDSGDIDQVTKKLNEFNESLSHKTDKTNLEGTFNKLSSLAEKIQGKLADANLPPKIRQGYQELADEIKNLINTGDVLPGTLNKITRAFMDLNAQDSKAKGFFRTVADRTREMNVKFLGQFFSFYDIIRYGREIFGVIEELDTSLVDLRKTTAMSASELENYYFESNKIAKQMGVTTNEIIQQSAAWSRLGYNTAEQTKQMAQLSSKFASISPGMDSDMAQEGLVSIMKAWDIETEDVERKILDNINTLGNKFAETNADIVTGMEKSAATFAALGQSSEDAFALFTGAQEVMQNAEVVGTALKTLSLRIRGYDEETEQLSADLVDVNGKVADLTKTTQHAQGISLFTDASQQHYRSMVDYLGEIADRWDEIDEKSRTQLLDKLFGKRGASVGSAILGNFDQVRKALEEMEKAAGSADAEMDIIRDSVEFKLNALKETWIGYAQELLQRDDIGQIIDKLIEGSESLQTTIDALAPAVEMLINLLSNLIGALGAVAEGFGPLTPILAGVGGFAFTDKKLDLLKNIDTTKLDARGEKLKNWWSGLFNKNVEENFDTLPAKIEDVGDVLEENLQEQIIHIGEDVEDLGEKSAEATKKLVSGTKEGQGAMDVLKGKFKSIMTIVTNPAFLGIAAAVAAIAIFKKVNTSVADVQKTIDQTTTKIKQLESEIESLNNKRPKTFEEQARLSYLNQELEIQKQLLEIEERRKAKESVQFDLEDLFSDDNYEVNITMNDSLNKDLKRFDYVKNKYEELKKEEARIDEYYADKTDDFKDSDRYAEKRLDIEEKIRNVEEQRADQLSYFIEKETQYRDDIFQLEANLQKLDQNSSAYDKTLKNIQERKKYLEQIRPVIKELMKDTGATYDYMDSVQGALDNFDGLEDKLVELYKTGDLTLEKIQQLFQQDGTTNNLTNLLTNQIIQALKDAGIEAENVYEVIRKIADPNFEKREETRKTLYDVINVPGNISKDSKLGKLKRQENIDNELKKYGIDTTNEVHLQAFLDVYTETPEGRYENWTVEQWAKEIQKKLTENPLRVDGHLSVSDALGDNKETLDKYYDTVSKVQEVVTKLQTGDYTQMDLAQWRTEYDLVGESAEDMVAELKKVEEESRNAVIELIKNLIEANPDDTELIQSLQLIKENIEGVRKEAEKKMNFNPGIDKLTKFNSALDSLKDSYIDFFKEGDQIDPGELSSIREVFGDLDEYQEFENAVLSGNADLDSSFDKLVSAYANHNDVLEGLTEANKQYYITALKDQGIVNAQEVVEKRLAGDLAREQKMKSDLAKMNESLGETKKNLAIDSENLENATWEEIVKLMMEGEQAGITSEELVLFALKKALAADISLANSGDISYLLSLAETAGIAAEQISNLASAKAALESSQAIYSDYLGKYGANDRRTISMKSQVDRETKALNEASKEAREAVANYKPSSMDLDFDFDATTAKGASGGGGSEETAETFDWIDTKIQRLERDITNLGKVADATYKTWAERTVALGQEMEKVNEQISLQESAYSAYMAKAESIGLSAQYKKLVQSGALKIDEITDETLKEQIQNYKEWYEKALDAKDKVEDLKSSLANLAKVKFDNIGKQFDDLISDIDHGLKYVTAQLESVETVGKIAGKSFYEEQIKAEQQRVNELTEELGQLKNALTEGLASGAIAYGSEMFNEMKSAIYGVEEKILDANNAILKFEQNIKQVAKANFDDLKSQFESAISILTDKIDLTDKIVNMVQATGHIASKAYYDALITGTDQNIQNLKKKYDELSKVFNEAVESGDVKEFSDEWYDMKSGIEAVKGEIIDATNSLIEYKNALRQIEWDLFDRGQTRLEQLVSESQFLIDLYEKYPLFDKETGDITSKGMATRGLLVQNYETYRQQAALLADEIARLKEELKADPKNTTLIDRLRELEEAERSAILASEGVKESLRDLLENEINALLEALQKLIDQYKKSLQAQKDLHDFQKNIDQQNKNINALKKQLMAYDNGSDTSEENRARVQKINDQLKQAEDQLKETEYDRYIQETQTLLDDFMQSLRDYFDEKLLDLNWVLERAIEDTNLNAETIRAQIEATGQETGYVYTEEFTKIWDNMTASDSLFSEQRDILASTGQVCTDIQAAVMELPTDEALGAYLDGSTLQIVSEIASVDSAVGGVQSAIGETNQALAQIQSKIAEYNASVLSSIADAKAAAEKAQQAANAAQATANEAKNKSSSGGDSPGGRSSSDNPTNKGTYENRNYYVVGFDHGGRPIERIDDLTLAEAQEKAKKYYKATVHHYAKGGLIPKDKNPLDLIAQQLGEDHMVAAKEGERILTAKQNENFEKLANAFSSLSAEDMAKYSILTGSKVLGNMPQLQMPTLRSMNSGNNTEINGGISINLPNVTNKAEFVEWLKTDGQIEKIVQSMTLGKLQGKNSYDKMKY